MKKLTLTFIMITLGLSSCSIKENRVPCPSYLDVFVSEESAEKGDCIISVIEKASSLVKREYIAEDLRTLELKLPKGIYDINALWGLSDCLLSDLAVVAERGSELDSLYSCSTLDFNATGELSALSLTDHKQFATLYLNFLTDRDYPYDIIVRGNIDGYNLCDLSPHEGEFFVQPQAYDEFKSKFALRIPRQIDNSLLVELVEKEDNGMPQSLSTKAADWQLINIGELIAQTDYDWSAADLEDITLTIDYARATISIEVKDWEVVWNLEIEI